MYTVFLSVNLRQNCTSEIKTWRRKILKWMLNKEGVRVWTGFYSISVGLSGGVL